MPTLFDSQTLGPLTLPNRLVMAPMTRSRTGEARVPGEPQALYYKQRASAGLIVTEATQVTPEGIGYLGTPGIHLETQVEGWRKVTDAVHEAGGRIFLQLWHVGRVSHSSFQPNGQLPVAPSAIAIRGELSTPNGRQPFETPRALRLDEIPDVVRQFADGARNAAAAGFDGVEIHGANGYLLDQFLRDGSNHRTDAYGGSVQHRARLLLEVVDAVTEVWGASRVGLRFSPLGAGNGMSDSHPITTFTHAARELSPRGLAYLHIIEPIGGAGAVQTERVTPHIRRAFHGPLILNGSYDGLTAATAIGRGDGDMVAFGVPFLANPDLPERLRAGAPLNEPDRKAFYGGGEVGYTDYPTMVELSARQK